MKTIYLAGAASLALLLAACGGGTDAGNTAASNETAGAEGGGHAKGEVHADEGAVTLSAEQIAAAGVQLEQEEALAMRRRPHGWAAPAATAGRSPIRTAAIPGSWPRNQTRP